MIANFPRSWLRRSPVDRDTIELLQTMKADNAAGPPYVRPGDGRDGTGKGWDRLALRLESLLKTNGIEHIEDREFNTWFAEADINSSVHYHHLCFMLYSLLREVDDWKLIDKIKQTQSKNSRNKRSVLIDEIWFTSDILYSLHSLTTVAKHEPSLLEGRPVVLDLGGGWGRIGHTLLRINKNATYIHVDIPIVSVIAQKYLPTTLTGVASYLYRDRPREGDLRRDYFLDRPGIHFLGSQDIERVAYNSVDLFINISSFQEMSNNTVEQYFAQIDRIVDGLFYMKQITAPNYKDGFITQGDDHYPILPKWQRIMLRRYPFQNGYFESIHKI